MLASVVSGPIHSTLVFGSGYHFGLVGSESLLDLRRVLAKQLGFGIGHPNIVPYILGSLL